MAATGDSRVGIFICSGKFDVSIARDAGECFFQVDSFSIARDVSISANCECFCLKDSPQGSFLELGRGRCRTFEVREGWRLVDACALLI